MDESFLPYAMIEPLLEEGMTGADLGRKLLEKLGLPKGLYQFRCPGCAGKSLRDSLRGGIVVEKLGATMIRDCKKEPVR